VQSETRMVRRHQRSWAVFAGWLVGACLGGQTGEPTSLTCSSRAAPWRQAVDGVSPEQLALTYEGEHRAKLHWAKNPGTVAEPATLTLDYREQSGTTDDCSGALGVAVDFSFRADNGTLIDAGQGLLRASRGVLDRATYSGSGQHFLITGSLSEAMGKVLVGGTLEPRESATADTADFSNDSEIGGTGGI